jgi:hypothetical protein
VRIDQVVTVAVAGVGWFPLSPREVEVLTIAARRLSREEEPRTQTFAALLDAARGGGADTVIAASALIPFLAEVVELVTEMDSFAASERLLALRHALAPMTRS